MPGDVLPESGDEKMAIFGAKFSLQWSADGSFVLTIPQFPINPEIRHFRFFFPLRSFSRAGRTHPGTLRVTREEDLML